jgi:hypothetical protein
MPNENPRPPHAVILEQRARAALEREYGRPLTDQEWACYRDRLRTYAHTLRQLITSKAQRQEAAEQQHQPRQRQPAAKRTSAKE